MEYAHECTGDLSHVHTEARGELRVSCSIAVYLIPLRQDLSRSLELGWQAGSLVDPFVSVTHNPRVTA